MKYNVVVTRDLPDPYTYSFDQKIDNGQIVSVDFRNKETLGVVIDSEGTDFAGKLKKISLVLPYKIPSQYVKFANFVSNYNLIKIGTVYKLIIPFSVDSLLLPEKDIKPQKVLDRIDIVLNNEQKAAASRISNYIGQFKTVVLHGVTGSGKTEVFLEVAKGIIEGENGRKQILILVPEIALSTELSKKVASRLGCDVFIWHNTISKSKKLNIWKKAIEGKKLIVVGARSALFIPFSNLGLIVIDEEHDMSFKQSETAIYNARDMAIYLAFCSNIPIILSSATPSVETYNNAKIKKYEYIKLNSRFYENAKLPTVTIDDLRKENVLGTLSEYSIKEIKACLSMKKQALIFVNRRGHTPKILCRSCGEKVSCPGCSSWLCYHQLTSEFVCHYCGFKTPVRDFCGYCGQKTLIGIGSGIEKLLAECSEIFPEAKLLALSSDTMDTPNKITKAIEKIKNNEVDIILGTQIVAKGHNFDNLSLVVITCVDAMLYGEDFRAMEKAFQLLYQVSGRAGRTGGSNSKVIIQTYNPDDYLMHVIQNNDLEGLYETELQNRMLTQMPPFGKMASITISALSEYEVNDFAKKLMYSMPRVNGIRIMGPIQPMIYKLRSRYRLKILILSEHPLQNYIKRIEFLTKIPNNIKVIIDIDPYEF